MKTSLLHSSALNILTILIGITLLVGSCTDKAPPYATISGTISDTTNIRLPNFRISLVGYKSVSFSNPGQEIEVYPTQTDVNGRFSQQVIWDRSVDYYEPQIPLINYDIKSCSGDNLQGDCRVNRIFNQRGTRTLHIMVKKR